MNEYSPENAKTLVTPDGHEIIVGRPASGKTTMLIDSLRRDWDAHRKIWLIGLFSREILKTHLADWIATTVDDAVQMLRELSEMAEHPANTYDLTLVIDDATFLLREIDVLTEVEFLTEQNPPWLRLRLALTSTLHCGVAGSNTLYNTLIEDAKETK